MLFGRGAAESWWDPGEQMGPLQGPDGESKQPPKPSPPLPSPMAFETQGCVKINLH